MPFDIATRPIHYYEDPKKLKLEIVEILCTSLKFYDEISSKQLDSIVESAKEKLK